MPTAELYRLVSGIRSSWVGMIIRIIVKYAYIQLKI